MGKLIYLTVPFCYLFSCGYPSDKRVANIKPSGDSVKGIIDKNEQIYIDDSIYYSKFKGFKVETVAKVTELEYKPLIELVRQGREKLKKEMASSEETKNKIDSYKAKRGGILKITIFANTPAFGDFENYRVVILSNSGKEIHRENLKKSYPRNNYGGKGYDYFNIDLISLNERLSFPIKVHLVNLLDSSNDEFIIKSLY